MEILTPAQMYTVIDNDYSKYVVIDRKNNYHEPDLNSILENGGFSGIGIEKHLTNIATAQPLWIAGGTAREFLDINTPEIKTWFGLPEPLQEAMGIHIPGIKEDIRTAHLIRWYQRSPKLDLDFIIETNSDLTSIPEVVALIEDKEIVGIVETANYPQRVDITPRDYDLHLSIVRSPEPDGYYNPPNDTLDDIKFRVEPSLKMPIDHLLKNEKVELSVIGLQNLFLNEHSKKATDVTIRILTHCLAEQNGIKVPINFGSRKEEFMLLELLTLSTQHILQNRNKYPTSLFAGNTYFKLLDTIVTNWPIFDKEIDPRIKGAVINAFRLTYS